MRLLTLFTCFLLAPGWVYAWTAPKIKGSQVDTSSLISAGSLVTSGQVNTLATAYLNCTAGQVPKMGSQGWGCSSEAGADLTAPGPIGATTPSTGNFTTVTTQILEIPLPPGTPGELQIAEDPAHGQHVVILRAPQQLSADVLLILPTAKPTGDGQCLRGNADGTLYFAACSP